MNALSGWVATSQVEGISQSQQILVSKMKHDAQLALEQSTDFLSQIGEQRVLTGKVLISNPKGNEDKECQIPILICETINDSAGYPRTEVSIPEQLPNSSSNSIDNVVRGDSNLPWHHEDVLSTITEEFLRLLDSSNAPKRVKDVIKNMYSSSDFETL